ncbi:MAG: hypothetical protein V3T86_14150, partial [Planctomycetota bacterium]
MYFRLVISARHPDSHRYQGIFVAAYALARSDDIEEYERDRIYEPLEWFGEHLIAPIWVSDRAIFWFRPDARECVRRVWDLAVELKGHGRPIRALHCPNPGRIEYEDEHQIAAIPHRHVRC